MALFLLLPALALATCPSAAPGPVGPAFNSRTIVSNGSTYWPYQTYETVPYMPTYPSINSSGQPLAPGYIFFTPSNSIPGPNITKQVGALIMTDKGELVYNGPSTTNSSIAIQDFRVQTLNGTDYLTLFRGFNTNGADIGHGYGNVTFYNSNYEPVYVVCPNFNLSTAYNVSFPCQADLHEHQVTPRGTLLVSAYNRTTADLSFLGGPKDGYIYDSLFFELDILTGAVLFRWSAIEHVPVNDTHLPFQAGEGTASAPFDYFHINSVASVGDDYLVSSRHTWKVLLVHGHGAGNIIWDLDGSTGGNFGTLPPRANFRWQHFARPRHMTNESLIISIFNNNNFDRTASNQTLPTVGLELQLPRTPGSSPVKVLKHVVDEEAIVYTRSQGSYTPSLPGGNQFMGYGDLAILREYGPNVNGSDLRWQAVFGSLSSEMPGEGTVQSYRAFKQHWKGLPKTKPALVLKDGKAYVSWNGATEVNSYEVYAGPSASRLALVGRVPKLGFETGFNISSACVQVAALSDETELGRSEVVCS